MRFSSFDFAGGRHHLVLARLGGSQRSRVGCGRLGNHDVVATKGIRGAESSFLAARMSIFLWLLGAPNDLLILKG